MAVLKSGSTTLEIKYVKIGQDPQVVYEDILTFMEVDLRFQGHWIINPALMALRETNSGLARKQGVYPISEAVTYEQLLIQRIQDALETEEPVFYHPYSGDVSFFIYPPVTIFPPTSPRELTKPSPDREKLPGDVFTVYVQVIEHSRLSGESVQLGTTLEVYRTELQAFGDDLKVEWTQFRERFPPQPIVLAHPPLALDLTPQVVEFYLFQSQETYGWINFHILIGGGDWEIMASSSFPPFDNVLKFFTAVAENCLPAFCAVDEEGRLKMLHARPWNMPGLLHLELVEEHFPHYKPLFTYLVERRAFVLAFYEHFVEFVDTHLKPELWNTFAPPFEHENLELFLAAVELMKMNNCQ